eukprot:TRINITY_DN9126_c0_g1_i1.p1 TRINITY_DN9126_c0_g1~~TRINITY_DN9126_c0_g1_i1.p1  ORF type:complete len:144 (+),score=14.87 TRINITY_DN9126_c0_g1_i1:87-518(+)
MRDMPHTDFLQGESVSDQSRSAEYCKNPSHRHFGINKGLKSLPTSCYNSLNRPNRKGSFIREDSVQVCDSGYNSLKRPAINTKEIPPSPLLQISNKLDHLASANASTCSSDTETPATVVNSMVCDHNCLEDKYITNKEKNQGK